MSQDTGGGARREIRQVAVPVVDGFGPYQPAIGDRALEQAARREGVPVLEASLGEDAQYVAVAPDDPALRIPERGGVGAGGQCSAGCSGSPGPRLKSRFTRLQ